MQFPEVKRTSTLMNLDGIPATHGDVRLSFTREIGELSEHASATLRVPLRLDRLGVPAPDVVCQKPAMERFLAARENLQRFASFEGSDQIDDRPEHAHGVTGFLESGGSGRFQEAREASGAPGTNGHAGAITGYSGGVDPRRLRLHGKIIHQEARFEIIGAVQQERKTGKQFRGIPGTKIGYDSFYGYVGIDGQEPALGSDRLRQGLARVRFLKKHLALKIGGLNEIPVKDAQPPDTGTDEQVGYRRPNRSAANQNGAGRPQALLAFRPERREQHLARVFLVERRVTIGVKKKDQRGPGRQSRVGKICPPEPCRSP